MCIPCLSRWKSIPLLLVGLVYTFPFAITLAEEVPRFVRPEQATTYVDPVTKTELTVLIDQHVGGTAELTLGYLVVRPGVDVPDHIHQSTETFYILSGEMEQTSEGKVQTLSAGMACLVPANTTTRHTVKSKEPVHALVIWTPGGEAKRIVKEWPVKAAQ
jgi:quercetin dioxygenase-like cupin family protein